MIGKTNCGNRSSSSFNGTLFHVTALAGSTISFAKDEITRKILGPQKSHINANNNVFAEWYYAVDSNSQGTWTITVTGVLNNSETIVVTNNKQYDIMLAYEYIYKNGIIYPIATDIIQSSNNTNGWSAGTLTKNTSKLTLNLPGGNRLIAASTSAAIDLSNYNTLYFDVISTSNVTGDGIICDMAITTSNSFSWGNNARTSPPYSNNIVTDYSTITRVGIKTLDISGYSGDFYITALLGGRAEANLDISAIYML